MILVVVYRADALFLCFRGGVRLSVVFSVGQLASCFAPFLVFRRGVIRCSGFWGPWGPLYCHWLLLGYWPFWK